MLPFGHFAFGYLLYSGFARVSGGRDLDGYTVLLIVAGTQFPDLVDKPFAWTFHVLPSGRSLAHSVFAAVFVSTVVYVYCQRRGRPDLGTAFAVGYCSHLLGDGFNALLTGQYTFLSYLGWPLLPPPPYGNEGGFISQLASTEFSSAFAYHIVFAVLLYVVWRTDGAPGTEAVRTILKKHIPYW